VVWSFEWRSVFAGAHEAAVIARSAKNTINAFFINKFPSSKISAYIQNITKQNKIQGKIKNTLTNNNICATIKVIFDFCQKIYNLNGENPMAKEALMKIKEAEEAAAEILRLAADEASLIEKEAAEAALARKAEIIAEALRQKQTILANAESDAKVGCASVVTAGEAEIEKILDPAPDKFEQAVNTVIERILRLEWQ
jgi:V/A-type H+-transporting ATPase subunit G/H